VRSSVATTAMEAPSPTVRQCSLRTSGRIEA
jgi:hypothetical protein